MERIYSCSSFSGLEAVLWSVEKELENILNAHSKGYGLRNVNHHIQLHYGAEYGLRPDLLESGSTGIRISVTNLLVSLVSP